MWSGSKDDQTSYVNLNFPDEPNFACFDFDITPTKWEDCHTPFYEAYMLHRDIDGMILI